MHAKTGRISPAGLRLGGFVQEFFRFSAYNGFVRSASDQTPQGGLLWTTKN